MTTLAFQLHYWIDDLGIGEQRGVTAATTIVLGSLSYPVIYHLYLLVAQWVLASWGHAILRIVIHQYFI
jgi:hypothetical protein